MILNLQEMSDTDLFDLIENAQQEMDIRRKARAQSLQDELHILISAIQNWDFHLTMSDTREQYFSLDPDDPLFIKVSP